jgi:hypothetical protein
MECQSKCKASLLLRLLTHLSHLVLQFRPYTKIYLHTSYLYAEFSDHAMPTALLLPELTLSR